MVDRNTMHALTAGLDVSDRFSYLCVLDSQSGDVMEDARIRTTQTGVRTCFTSRPPMRIALETGTHSPWISHILRKMGHEVIVANARRLKLITANVHKRDATDAEQLARLVRIDPQLLKPIQHRAPETQAALAVMRSRDALVQSRTRLVNHVRGMAKACGHRLPSCSAGSFHRRIEAEIPTAIGPAVSSILTMIGELTQQIRDYDRALTRLAERYPATHRLRQVTGVGPLTSLAFVLVLEDPYRFRTGRDVGAYLGLTPARKQSGAADPPQRITKHGDKLLRRLLVQSAHYILGPFGPDCDLRRFGLHLCARGGRYAKAVAAVAVARKLAGLLYQLWKSEADYDPFYQSRAQRPTLHQPERSVITH